MNKIIKIKIERDKVTSPYTFKTVYRYIFYEYDTITKRTTLQHAASISNSERIDVMIAEGLTPSEILEYLLL